jgi:hypothetical protein
VGYGFGHRISIGSMPIVSASSAPTIWKIAIFGAGTTTSNGEYVWDGVTFSLGERLYMSGNNSLSWDGTKWYISDEDGLGGDASYSSLDLITWTIENGDSPAPTSTFSYSPNSVIQSLTLDGSEIATSSGTYDWDGVTTELGKPKYVKTTAGGVNYIVWDGYAWALFDDEDIGDYTYTSNDLITWTDLPNGAPPSPYVVTLSYSA